MTRRPPRSTLFPTRRSSDLRQRVVAVSIEPADHSDNRFADIQRKPDRGKSRSEEHTSELQSRFDLVCRLLLEKKKITLPIHTVQPQSSMAKSHIHGSYVLDA